MAPATDGEVAASIGCRARPTCNRAASSPATPSVRARIATAPRSPSSVSAVCAARVGTPALLATASVINPSRAPWRSSPVNSRRKNCCSAAVARDRMDTRRLWREATEPVPTVTPNWSTNASTSMSATDAVSAAATSSPVTVAHPTPMRP